MHILSGSSIQAFNVPARKEKQVLPNEENEESDTEPEEKGVIAAGKTINDKYAESNASDTRGNTLKGEGGMLDLTINDAVAGMHDLKVVEKEEDDEYWIWGELSVEKEVVSDMLHKYEELRPGIIRTAKTGNGDSRVCSKSKKGDSCY